jgi:molecular chaperone GrpE
MRDESGNPTVPQHQGPNGWPDHVGAAEDARETATDRSDEMELAADALTRLEDQLRRTTADLDKMCKRYQTDLVRAAATERARVAASWLPIVDSLEQALRHAEDDAKVFDAVRAVLQKAVAALAELGFPRFDPYGQDFDPLLHEAVGTVRNVAEHGTVVNVTRPGYGTPEDLLRQAGVVVAKR